MRTCRSGSAAAARPRTGATRCPRLPRPTAPPLATRGLLVPRPAAGRRRSSRRGVPFAGVPFLAGGGVTFLADVAALRPPVFATGRRFVVAAVRVAVGLAVGLVGRLFGRLATAPRVSGARLADPAPGGFRLADAAVVGEPLSATDFCAVRDLAGALAAVSVRRPPRVRVRSATFVSGRGPFRTAGATGIVAVAFEPVLPCAGACAAALDFGRRSVVPDRRAFPSAPPPFGFVPPPSLGAAGAAAGTPGAAGPGFRRRGATSGSVATGGVPTRPGSRPPPRAPRPLSATRSTPIVKRGSVNLRYAT